MKTLQIESFKIIGIKIRTTNENMQAAKDIPAVWKKFMAEGITNKIPNRESNSVYAIYTNYESDHTGAYDMILGCKVVSLEVVPEGLIGVTFDESMYSKFIAKGNLDNNIVYDKWIEIWNTKLKRKYTADFEIYDEKAMDKENAEVAIYISID